MTNELLDSRIMQTKKAFFLDQKLFWPSHWMLVKTPTCQMSRLSSVPAAFDLLSTKHVAAKPREIFPARQRRLSARQHAAILTVINYLLVPI